MDEIDSFEDLDIIHEYNSNRNFVYADFFNKILPEVGIVFVRLVRESLGDFLYHKNGVCQFYTSKFAVVFPLGDSKI